jgi:hypothetical protein
VSQRDMGAVGAYAYRWTRRGLVVGPRSTHVVGRGREDMGPKRPRVLLDTAGEAEGLARVVGRIAERARGTWWGRASFDLNACYGP